MFAGSKLSKIRNGMKSVYSVMLPKPMLYNTNMLRYFGSIINVKLPDLGEGTKEATLKEWFVTKGQQINEFDDVCEVFTDKLVAQIPSTHTGIIKNIYFQADDVCPVGSILADIEILEDEGEPIPEVDSASQSKPEETSAAETPTTSQASKKVVATGGKVLSTPVTRHYAKTLGVDITQVVGTGKDGRVLDSDVDNFLNAPAAKSGGFRSMVQQAPLKGITEQDDVKKIIGVMKGMTKTMTEALSIPSFTYQDEYDCTALMKLRKELKVANPKLTLLPFFVKAISLALRNHPLMNVNINPDVDDDGYIYEYVIKHDHNISVAVDSVNGLVVPNIKKVQTKSIIQINQDTMDLRDKAESGKLTMDDFEGGTFSVSSVGNMGGQSFVPTIMRPQGAIVAIGKAKKRAHFVETNEKGHVFEPRDFIGFSFSCDHRVIDGATCARFSEDVRKLIENPQNMLLNMN
jgi:2-oxoisovalerate dehydrogenase E2 component (dihydrolipoyl transacylase)